MSNSLKNLITECEKLTQYRDKYYKQKAEFLGLTCIASCLYQKPIRELTSVKDLPVSYEQYMTRISPTKEEQLVICSYMGSLKKFHLMYDEKLLECKELLRKYVKTRQINIERLRYAGVPVIKTQSKIRPIKLVHELALPSLSENSRDTKLMISVRKVYSKLDELSEKIAVTFERRWSFRTIEPEPVDTDLETVFVKHSICDVFDFFGFVSFLRDDGNIACTPFVIQCVSDVLNSEELAKLRCQQYQLYQMNICFLYLNPDTPIEKLVSYFMRKLSDGSVDTYLALGTLKKLNSSDYPYVSADLATFYSDYSVNHVNTLKHQKYLRATTKKEREVVLIDAKKEREKLKKASRSTPDRGYTVSESDFTSLTSQKYIFTR